LSVVIAVPPHYLQDSQFWVDDETVSPNLINPCDFPGGPVAPSRFLAVPPGWPKVIACQRLAGPRADRRTPATTATTRACSRHTARPPATAARKQRLGNVHGQDQGTVERGATLPASLLRSGTLPIGRGPMTALLASSQNVPQRCQSVINKESPDASADTRPVRTKVASPRRRRGRTDDLRAGGHGISLPDVVIFVMVRLRASL
jgi:hypothetical protein